MSATGPITARRAAIERPIRPIPTMPKRRPDPTPSGRAAAARPATGLPARSGRLRVGRGGGRRSSRLSGRRRPPPLVGRVGDGHALSSGLRQVDLVYADPAEGHDAQGRKALQQRRGGAEGRAGHDRPDPFRVRAEPSVLIGDLEPPVHDEALIHPGFERRRMGPKLQDVEGHGRRTINRMASDAAERLGQP